MALYQLQNVGLEDQELLADLAVGRFVLFAGADKKALEVCCFGDLVCELAAEVGVFPDLFLELLDKVVVCLLVYLDPGKMTLVGQKNSIEKGCPRYGECV